ncbi:MAG: hypothetical protein ABI960_00365 [Candidatus Eisenbacteria bacterium]
MVRTPSPVFPGAWPRAARFVLLAVIAASAFGCSSARPALPSKPQDRAVMRERGAAMIDSLVAAHGGMENWNKVVEMTFRGTDDWKGPFDRLLNPWPVERAAGQNSFRMHENLGRIAIVTDRGTLAYGVGKTGPWALLRGEPSPDPKDERTASYVVPWNSFLAGLPWRFKEKGAVAHYLGRAHRRYQNTSLEFDEVLVTYPPESDYWPDDWFIVRMDPATHEMRTLTYTTANRAGAAFETTCEFSDYVTVEGLKIPTRRVCMVSSPVDRDLHTWQLADVRFNQVSPDAYFERQTAGRPLPQSPDSMAAAAVVDSLKGRAVAAVDSAKGSVRAATH